MENFDFFIFSEEGVNNSVMWGSLGTNSGRSWRGKAGVGGPLMRHRMSIYILI